MRESVEKRIVISIDRQPSRGGKLGHPRAGIPFGRRPVIALGRTGNSLRVRRLARRRGLRGRHYRLRIAVR